MLAVIWFIIIIIFVPVV